MKESTASSISNTLTTVIFCGLIALPAIGTVFHWDFYPLQDENRRFAGKPVFAETGLEGYPGAFEAYYDGHFGFRNTYIRRYRHLWREISGKESQQVLIGEDDWLFFLSGGVITDFVGMNPFTEADLKAWQGAVENRTHWLAERNCAYLYTVAPNKPRIYPEHLPEETRSLAKPGRVTQLSKFLEKHSAARILYLRNALLEAKEGGQVYFSNDTHWTDYGSFTAHRTIVEHLQRRFPGLEPVAPDAVTYVAEPNGGDLGFMTVNPSAFEGIRNRMSLRNPAPLENRLFPLSPETEEDRHLLASHPPITQINSGGKYRAIVFHDSFGEFGLKNLLPQVFHETTFFYCDSDPEILKDAVDKLKPDIVIDLVVERGLMPKVGGDDSWFKRLR